jgi:hypothetical protein
LFWFVWLSESHQMNQINLFRFIVHPRRPTAVTIAAKSFNRKILPTVPSVSIPLLLAQNRLTQDRAS